MTGAAWTDEPDDDYPEQDGPDEPDDYYSAPGAYSTEPPF